MNKTIRFVSVLSMIAMAAASQAVQIFIDSQVATGFPGVPFSNYNEVVDLNVSQSPFNGIAVGSNALLNFNGGAGSTARYTATNGDTVTFTFNSATTITTGNSIGFQSLGTVTSTTGTMFTQFLNQTGVIVSSTTNTSSGQNNFTINGSLQAAPEPASFAALGVGAMALIRRRRKA